MRLRERDKHEVSLKHPIPNDDRYKWGVVTSIRAIVQPLSGRLSAQIYGERTQRMRLMLYDGDYPLAEGMGVCLDVSPNESCDYRIVALERWDHWRATLEWIPEAVRG